VGRRTSGPREGFFIALEGGEGAGKTTQARALRGWLESLGHDVVVTFEPGATEVGRRLRSVLLDHPEAAEGVDDAAPVHLSPRAEALLFAADRAVHVARVIQPALASGRSVVTDRYVESSLAYQAFGRGLPLEEVRALSAFATGERRADAVVVLDVDPSVGAARRGRAPDRMEAEDLAFHERVRSGFGELAAAEPGRIAVVDGSAEVDEVAERVWAAVEERLG
jgi:dTMP kinase